VVLRQVLPITKEVELAPMTIADYEPYTKTFSKIIRYCRYRLDDNPYEGFIQTLQQFPEARLFRTNSHEPITNGINEAQRQILNLYELADSQRVIVDGVPYIDDFGLHVYAHTWLSLDGAGSDTDERELLNPETF
jgi:hypothetical protein